MIAHVTTPDGKTLGIHRTFLRPGGMGKVDHKHSRMMLGPVKGGAVHMAPAGPQLAIAEGIETALAFQAVTHVPTWAALSTAGMKAVALPPVARTPQMIIAADGDEAGALAARALEQRAIDAGHSVTVLTPPAGYDFADLVAGDFDDAQLLGAVQTERT
jgi:phage/plasmid primase-like uncharacterized protein